MKNKIKKYSRIVLGILLSAVAFNLFLAPYNFASSGVSGLSIIINKVIGIEEGIFILAMNIILTGISYRFLGWEKTKNSIIGAIIFPIFISLTSKISEFIVIENLDYLFVALLGGVLSGIGYGLVYQNNYTTGGTDIINQLVEKYLKIPMGKAILFTDGFVVLLGFITFGFTTMIYSLIVLYLVSEFSNRTMLKLNHNQLLFIESSKIDEIKKYVIEEFNYGTTLLNTKGGFTKKSKQILFCVISKKDYYLIKESILLIDPQAFLTVVTAYEQKNGHFAPKINTRKSQVLKKS